MSDQLWVCSSSCFESQIKMKNKVERYPYSLIALESWSQNLFTCQTNFCCWEKCAHLLFILHGLSELFHSIPQSWLCAKSYISRIMCTRAVSNGWINDIQSKTNECCFKQQCWRSKLLPWGSLYLIAIPACYNIGINCYRFNQILDGYYSLGMKVTLFATNTKFYISDPPCLLLVHIGLSNVYNVWIPITATIII